MTTATYQVLDLSTIRPSATNPRRTFDEKKLAELAASIREKGVLQPIIVRPTAEYVVEQPDKASMWYVSSKNAVGGLNRLEPHKTKAQAEAALAKRLKDGDAYELVAGERRYRASKLAKLTTIPAVVRDLDDKAVAEIQVIENDQREDVAPLEQAEGYQRLIEQGYDVAAIATKIGRSESYIYSRLQITQLIPAAKKDMQAGKLPFAQGHLLSTMDAAIQRELYGRHFYDYNGAPQSVRQLRHIIRENHLTNLSSAPWKWDDATLLPEAGACSACPKRTSVRRGLFDELLNGDGKGKSDFCTERACWARKKEAFIQLQLRTASAGQGTPALKVTTDWYSRDDTVLTKDRFEIVSAKEAKKAKPGELRTAVIVSGDQDDPLASEGKIVQVRVKKEDKRTTGGSSSMNDWKVKQRIEENARRALAIAAFERIRDGKVKSFDKLWPVLFPLVLGYTKSDTNKQLAKLLDCEPNAAMVTAWKSPANTCIAAAALIGLMQRSFNSSTAAEKAFMDALGLDASTIRREAAAAVRAKAKGTKKKTVAKAKS